MAKFKFNLSNIVGKYIGVPYELGGRSFSGMDCLGLVNSIGREFGISIPDEFEGICDGGAADLWTESPEVAKRTLVSYVLSLGEKINLPSLFPSDLVLFKDGSGDLGIGVYVGNGLILASFVGEMIDIVQRDTYPIKAAIRWVVIERGVLS